MSLYHHVIATFWSRVTTPAAAGDQQQELSAENIWSLSLAGTLLNQDQRTRGPEDQSRFLLVSEVFSVVHRT